MIKALVVYESRNGNTRRAAEAIIEGMCRDAEAKAVLSDVSKVESDHIDWYDLIVVGSPNHLGGPTDGITQLLDKLRMLNLDQKRGTFFDTCLSEDHQKAVRKMEEQVQKKVPQMKLLIDGLSLKLEGEKGPLVAGEIEKCRAFGRELILRMNGSGSA